MAEAWVTLATNDSYSLGALVLGHSLRATKTSRKLVVLVTPTVSNFMREQLKQVFDVVAVVDVLNSNDAENLALIQRPDLGVTFSKLHCWRLTEFTKCVFLDADTLVLQNADELFAREELSAAPDIGWPDCFNSGVFVYKPSLETYRALLQFAAAHGSFDGGDQGLLNSYFHGWAQKDAKFRLPFIFNMTSSVTYAYAAAYKQFGKDVKIVHFIGNVKPWYHGYNVTTSTVYYKPESGHGRDLIEKWWSVFGNFAYPALQAANDKAGLAATFKQLSLYEGSASSERDHQARWEAGQIDYTGADSFENIQRYLEAKVQKPPAAVAESAPKTE